MKRMIVLSIAICLIFLVVPIVYAAEVKNLTVKQSGNRMLCEYDLMGDEGVAEVNVTITVKSQAYSSDKLHIEGDFGKVKPGNGKKIWWNVLQDFPRGVSDDVEWDVVVVRKKSISAMPLTMGARSSVSTGNEIRRDGRFIAYENGTVLDTSTNLMWAAKDNGSDINWSDARSYCENYRGGGYTDWRMPTKDELAGMFDKLDERFVTNLIHLTKWAAWSSDIRRGNALRFLFDLGQWSPSVLEYSSNMRALPVRSAK